MVDQTGSYDWVFILALTAGSLSAFILLAISPKVTRQTLTVYES
jgi:hypothetical protein